MVHKLNLTILAYEVKPNGTRGPLLIIHYNMLRPFTFMATNPEAERDIVTEPARSQTLDLLNNMRKHEKTARFKDYVVKA